eukprot:7790280-Alexandrium_andersonii.AAC.1
MNKHPKRAAVVRRLSHEAQSHQLVRCCSVPAESGRPRGWSGYRRRPRLLRQANLALEDGGEED